MGIPIGRCRSWSIDPDGTLALLDPPYAPSALEYRDAETGMLIGAYDADGESCPDWL